MDISLEHKNSTDALIKIKINEVDFQPKVDQKIKEYAKKANIKGFRTGKVPPGMIKKMYGKSILIEEINQILSESLRNYLQNSDLKMVGEPLPIKESIENINWDNPSDLEVAYEIGTVKDFDLDVSKKMKIKKYIINVDDKLVKETIENLRQQHAISEEVETVADNSTLFGELRLSDGDFSNHAVLSKALFKDKQFKPFIGKRKGEVVEFNAQKSFLSDTQIAEATGMEVEEAKLLSGNLAFEIDKITNNKPAPLNQEFFDKLFGQDAIKSDQEFKEKVAEIIAKNYETESETLLNRDIQRELLEKAKIDLPDEFLKKWLTETNDKVTQEEINNEYERFAQGLRWNLITEKIAKDQNIKVEHTEVVEETKNMFKNQFSGQGMNFPEDKLDEFADYYLKGEDGKNYRQVYEQAFGRKIMEFIQQNIEIKTEKVSLDKFRKLAEN